MVVNDVGIRHVNFISNPYRIVSIDDADLDAFSYAALDQFFALAGQRFVFGIRNFASQSKSPGRIAVRAGVSLDKNAVENGIFGVVNPVFVGLISAPYAEVDAAHRNMA